MLTATIDAYEGRDVMTADVPNVFIQTELTNEEDGKERIIMKIAGVIVDMLVNISPDLYTGHVVYENGKKVMYVSVLRAIYGMLISAILFYRKFWKDLEEIDFIFNPYDSCVANRIINGKQHTIRFHVDNLMSSHKDKKVNDEFLQWLNTKYGDLGKVTATRANIHDYLGMKFEYGNKEVKINMIEYVTNMLKEFPLKFKKDDKAPNLATTDMFKEDNSKKLNTHEKELFHRFTAKALFLCKRARPDIQPIVAALCTRVKSPGKNDWNKLVRLMKYLNGTRTDKLILSTDKGIYNVEWYIDAAFAVHPDFKSHTGGVMRFTGGKGA